MKTCWLGLHRWQSFRLDAMLDYCTDCGKGDLMDLSDGFPPSPFHVKMNQSGVVQHISKRCPDVLIVFGERPA